LAILGLIQIGPGEAPGTQNAATEIQILSQLRGLIGIVNAPGEKAGIKKEESDRT
jgi:hypothetical protein